MKAWNYRRIRLKAAKTEVDAARVFNGRRQPASGAMSPASLKGDVKSSTFLVECKNTSKKQFSLSSKLWRKIRLEAVMARRYPAMYVELGDGQKFIVLELFDFRRMLNLWEASKH